MEYSGLNDLSAKWDSLTLGEKGLIMSDPVKGAITFASVEQANEGTIAEDGHNRIGDESDEFRHAYWNGLMTIYAGKSWARDFETAHEAISNEDLIWLYNY